MLYHYSPLGPKTLIQMIILFFDMTEHILASLSIDIRVKVLTF